MKRFILMGIMAGIGTLAAVADVSRVDAGSLALCTPGSTMLRVHSEGGGPLVPAQADAARAARLQPAGYLYVPALSALVMGDQALPGCP